MSTTTAQLFSPYPLDDYRHHRKEILGAVEAALEAGVYILGNEVAAFEQEFAAFAGCRHAIGVANGTDAIELLLRALGIGAGDQVAVPSHTAVASVSALQRAGAAPVFVDIDSETFTMDPAALADLLASPTGQGVKAVLAVHLYGHPCAMDRLQTLCDEHGLVLIEDCAQAHGATWQGRPAGSISRGAAFSFYPTKNLGAIGDGGAVTTNDDALAERVRCLRQYGWRERYISAEAGVNSRLDELQAAVLRVKLRTFAESNTARHHLAGLYADLLAGCAEVRLPVVRAGCKHAYHLFVIRCARRDELLKHLIGNGIPAALHYPAAVHQQPAYRGIAARSPALPRTEEAVLSILSLPLHPHLPEEAVRLTARAIGEFFAVAGLTRMLDHEYDTMRKVEDTYWWYQALRGYVAAEVHPLVPTGQPGRLLDAGCGTGGMMEHLRRAVPQWELTGFDFSARAVDYTRRRGFDRVFEARLDAIPSADSSWDAVVSLDVLYHMSVNEPRAMAELFRVLRPGGSLVLNLPAFDCLFGHHDVAVQGARRYTTHRVRQLLEAEGFQVRRLHYWNAWTFPAVLAWRWLSRFFDSAGAAGATSDLRLLPGPLNRALLSVARLDLQACRALRPPFGTSVFAVAEKPAPPTAA